MAADTLTSRTSQPPGQLWFGILGGPFAWALQGLLGWFVAAGGCGHANPSLRWMTDAGVRASELTITVIALLIAVAALGVGLRAWRGSADRSLAAVHARVRPDFVAASALLVSAVFLLAIAWAGLAAFILPACESMR
jgi:hypothetical protein